MKKLRERLLQSRPKGKSKNREGRGRNVEKGTCREAVDAIISAITDSLGREEKVTLVRFGTFQVMERKARRFLNRVLYERNTFNFDASSARGAKRVYPRFSKSDWDMLNRVSKKTNRRRTELVREAVDEYLRGSP